MSCRVISLEWDAFTTLELWQIMRLYLQSNLVPTRRFVVIAAWLHDVASITDYNLYEEHHIHGAKIAKEILEKFDYDKEKINQVELCVLNHSGSISGERLSLEEMCVADADAISHFDNVPSLLYLVYVKRNLDIDEGKEFVKAKLIRSYEKISEESKIFYRDKFEQVMSILN